MTFVLMARHPHKNDLLDQYLMAGDLVSVDEPVTAEKLLAMRGGVSYGHTSFEAFSGPGFPYFTPVSFSVESLALELSKAHHEAKVVSAPAAAKAVEEPKKVEEPQELPSVEEAAEPEAAEASKPRARKQP